MRMTASDYWYEESQWLQEEEAKRLEREWEYRQLLDSEEEAEHENPA